jgi:hypothetical protein
VATPRTIRIRVAVDTDSPAEAVVAAWLRSWRRRGVRADGKPDYPHQGAAKATIFHAPPEAVADLEQRLAATPSAALTRA